MKRREMLGFKVINNQGGINPFSASAECKISPALMKKRFELESDSISLSHYVYYEII